MFWTIYDLYMSSIYYLNSSVLYGCLVLLQGWMFELHCHISWWYPPPMPCLFVHCVYPQQSCQLQPLIIPGNQINCLLGQALIVSEAYSWNPVSESLIIDIAIEENDPKGIRTTDNISFYWFQNILNCFYTFTQISSRQIDLV